MLVGAGSQRLSLFLCAAAFSATLTACGLPTNIYLYPPGFSASANQLSITNNPNNYDVGESTNQSFKGYEIYYRAYSDSATATAMATTLAIKVSTYTDNPVGFMSYANTAGFFRIKLLEGDGTPVDTTPLISISAAKAQSEDLYYLNLEPNSDWLESDGTTNHPVCRSMSNLTRSGFYKKANYLSSSNDEDFVGNDSPSIVYFVFFAVAYGNDPTSPWESVYSIPVVLSGGVVSYVPGL